MEWKLCHPKFTAEGLGYLPSFLSESDPRSAREQLDAGYSQFGGWTSFPGFKMTERGLEYPGDPPQPLLAETRLRDEIVRLYNGSWVAIIQPDGSYDIARMD